MAESPVLLNKKKEAQFARKLSRRLKVALPDKYVVHTGKSILYKLEVDVSGRLVPNDIGKPIRGQYAFQTDILIEKKKPSIPLVVIELKYGSFSTHDIITYSSKASRHKDIYPYLRYGFVIGGLENLSRKFLTHNQGVDFAMALPKRVSKEAELLKLIRGQIRNAERLIEVMQTNRSNFSKYEKTIKITI